MDVAPRRVGYTTTEIIIHHQAANHLRQAVPAAITTVQIARVAIAVALVALVHVALVEALVLVAALVVDRV